MQDLIERIREEETVSLGLLLASVVPSVRQCALSACEPASTAAGRQAAQETAEKTIPEPEK
jgi:hypothetical protein